MALMDGLRDIHGLDGVPWWPLAPGWWLLLALVLSGLALYAGRRWLERRDPLAGWRREARRRLRGLRRRVARDDPKALLGELSELLRRIAMQRCGRQGCAGLSGEEWLQWLDRNDPAGFAWAGHAELLLVAPYAPPGHPVDRAALRILVDAALRWVDRMGRPAAGARRVPRPWIRLRRGQRHA